VRFNFFLSEALSSLRRNWVMTVAAVLTVFISMAILGLVLVIDRNLNQGATSLKNRVMIEVFLKDSATPEQVAALKSRIESMPEVKGAPTYVSKDEALAEFKQRLGANAASILQNLSTNPLPASFRIYVKNPNEVDRVAARFFNDPIVDNTPGTHDGVRYAQQTVRRMLGTIDLVEKGMWVATIIFSAAAILLISTTVRLSIFARRREIEIMRLVGATNWFIRWPFVVRLRRQPRCDSVEGPGHRLRGCDGLRDGATPALRGARRRRAGRSDGLPLSGHLAARQYGWGRAHVRPRWRTTLPRRSAPANIRSACVL